MSAHSGGGSGHVLGASSAVGTGAVILPNTGGNPLLTFAAIASIVVGSAVLVSMFARLAVKRAFSRG